MCMTCKGKGSIYRPLSRSIQEIVRKTEFIDGHKFETKEAVVVECGGMDACPVCTARAEAEWQSRKRGSNAA